MMCCMEIEWKLATLLEEAGRLDVRSSPGYHQGKTTLQMDCGAHVVYMQGNRTITTRDDQMEKLIGASRLYMLGHMPDVAPFKRPQPRARTTKSHHTRLDAAGGVRDSGTRRQTGKPTGAELQGSSDSGRENARRALREGDVREGSFDGRAHVEGWERKNERKKRSKPGISRWQRPQRRGTVERGSSE